MTYSMRESLETRITTEKKSKLEKIADFVEKKWDLNKKYKTAEQDIQEAKSKSLIKKILFYSSMGSAFPTEVQEKYCEIAGIPKKRMSWYSIAYGTVSQTCKYSLGHGLSYASLIAGGAFQILAAAFAVDILIRTAYVLIKKKPIALIPIEISYRIGNRIKKRVEKKKQKIQAQNELEQKINNTLSTHF